MINDFIFHLFSYLCSTIKKHPIIMKNFIKGFRFTPSNYPAEVEAKIQKYRKQGYKLPPRKVLRTPEQLEGIRESAIVSNFWRCSSPFVIMFLCSTSCNCCIF